MSDSLRNYYRLIIFRTSLFLHFYQIFCLELLHSSSCTVMQNYCANHLIKVYGKILSDNFKLQYEQKPSFNDPQCTGTSNFLKRKTISKLKSVSLYIQVLKEQIKFGHSEKHTKFEKNLPHGFDKSADLLSKCQNLEGDFFQIICASQKVRTLK